ncbi:helix-turn-helix domain-containing protein [Kitasatospora sp. NPDC088346]|uniref:helix-turn-helix domain-containing protein n=1 Tax=Kitasatospora sp. NPDC088346 TaxID=3364073 RepID=UPI003822DB97
MNRRTLDPTSSPLAALAVQLRRSREAAGLTQVGLGLLVGYSNTYISNTETAKEPPSLTFVQRADDHLNTGGSLELLWWSWKNGSLIPGFPEYVAHEANATALRIFQPRIIPGLLQTAEYATAMELANVRRGKINQSQADARVRFLLERQRIFAKTPRPTLRTIMDETCLDRPIGGADAMIRQLRHLEEIAQQPKTTIQIALNSVAEAHPLSHPVTLLTMPGRVMLGYTEGLQRGYLERDSETVASWAEDYDQLQAEALSPAASLAIIRRLREDFEHAS